MPPQPTIHIQTRRGENVRIGPVSVITLIVVICMAVMGVLAASTAHATAVISNRQADATQRMYLNENAAQEFLASMDEVLADVRAAGGSAQAGAAAVDDQLDSICEKARAAGQGRVSCTALVDGTTVTAEFICEETRLLNIVITIRDGSVYRIDQWKMSSAQQEPATAGTLWQG